MSKKALHIEHDEWVDAVGTALKICILHELMADNEETYQAIAIVGGMSLCREHMDITAGLMIAGYDVSQIMEMTYEGTLNTLYEQGVKPNEQGVQHQEASTGSGSPGSSEGTDSPPPDLPGNYRPGHDSGAVGTPVVQPSDEQDVSGGVRQGTEGVDQGADQLP